MAVSTPRSLADALAELDRHPDALVVAGGTDAMVEINSGRRREDHVVSIDRVAELRRWHNVGDSYVTIGAGLTFTDLMKEPFASMFPALAQASRTVGSPQIRNAATLGGNLATCSPAGDALPVLLALECSVHLEHLEHRRHMDVETFMTGVKRTDLEPGEPIGGVSIPLLDGWQGYSKVGVRNAMVIAIASSCLAVSRSEGAGVRVALGSVGSTVIRCYEAEAWIRDRLDLDAPDVTEAFAAEFGRRCAAEARPIDDHRSTAAYRRHAIEVLTRRQLERAFGLRGPEMDHG